MGEVETVEPALPLETAGHAVEDLARDHPGVAASAHERPEADRGGDPIGRLAGRSLRLLERDPDGRRHVRAGVAVGDREDVHGVDLVDVSLEVGHGRAEGRQQAGAVTASARHRPGDSPVLAGLGGVQDARLIDPVIQETCHGRRRRLVAHPTDVDRQPIGLAIERPTERVADGRVDLAGDLGDRQPERRRSVGDRR